MIFVILGTQKFQQNRLLRMLDECKERGEISDEMIAQSGYSDYEPRHIVCHRFLEKSIFESYIDEADVVVSHAGVGSIMTALEKEKPVVVFPRLAKYGEHVDDHQEDIARAFAGKGYILFCGETDSLPQLIEKAKNHRFSKYTSQTGRIVDLIESFLQSNFPDG